MDVETNSDSGAAYHDTSVPPPQGVSQLPRNQKFNDVPQSIPKIDDNSLTNQNISNVPPSSQTSDDVSVMSQKAEDISVSGQKVQDISVSSQKVEDVSLNNTKTNDVSLNGEITEKIQAEDNNKSKTEQNGLQLDDKSVVQEEVIIQKEKEANEESSEANLRMKEDEELRKYNRKIPEERSAVKKDKIDEHFDRLPWVFGAIGRVLNLGVSYGPQFAPINIPLRRRFQTFAVLFWMSTFLFLGASSTLFLLYLFFYTKYWWVSLCYLTWFLGDRTVCNRGGRRFEWLRRWGLWKHYRDFFPIHLIKTADLDPSKNYIMGYHPHGVLSAGAFCHFATEGTDFSKRFPGFTPYLLTLEAQYILPFYREYFMSTGAVSATRESMDYLLGREGSGRALCLVVGGAKESLDCHPGSVVLHLNKRKGFCKMALRHGASLVPMFSFGENEIYDQIANPEGSFVRRFQNALQKLIGLAPCMFIGRGVFQYSLGIVPFRKPIYTVVGTPIDVPLVKNPTKEEIVGLHETYVNAVIDLYNKYKHKYSEFPECDIKIV
ncbi:2-acylglycerol O-acyltransferase 1-like isoform X2 [Homarus americanus]|nr:2-acylglycerol O-acyltransferase 1-like isoform X2 [Homarus americanus]